jgi:hypothetical protein
MYIYMSNKISLNLYDPNIYKKFVENLILYWYNDFITFSDGIQEVIVKKTNISSIINTYNSINSVYNRYIKSNVNIICDNGFIIECLIVSSPQTPPGEGTVATVLYPNGYPLGTHDYTNGNNITINSYKKNNILYKISGNTVTIYTGFTSLYNALIGADIKFRAMFRNDYPYNALIDGKFVGNVSSGNLPNVPVLPTECVLALECTNNVQINNSGNLILWNEIFNDVLFTPTNSIFDENTLTTKGFPSVRLGVTGALSSNINFGTYNYPSGTDPITISILIKIVDQGTPSLANTIIYGNSSWLQFNISAESISISYPPNSYNAYTAAPSYNWKLITFRFEDNQNIKIYNNNNVVYQTNTGLPVLVPVPGYDLGTANININSQVPMHIAGFYVFDGALSDIIFSNFVSYIDNKFGIL